MTDIEQKALALEMIGPGGIYEVNVENMSALVTTLKAAIEQHEAFKQEVSDAVEVAKAEIADRLCGYQMKQLDRFIIAKPDPLVEVLNDMGLGLSKTAAEEFRAAIKKRGGKIVWRKG